MRKTLFKILLLLIIFFLEGCLYDKVERKIAEYKLKDGRTIEFIYYNGGATTPMGLWVKKKDDNIIIGDLNGFNDKYLVSCAQIYDSIIKVTLTDTVYFKGKRTDFVINVNKKL